MKTKLTATISFVMGTYYHYRFSDIDFLGTVTFKFKKKLQAHRDRYQTRNLAECASRQFCTRLHATQSKDSSFNIALQSIIKLC